MANQATYADKSQLKPILCLLNQARAWLLKIADVAVRVCVLARAPAPLAVAPHGTIQTLCD